MNKSAGFIGFGKLGSTLSSAIAENNSIEWIVESDEESREFAKEVFPNVSVYSSIEDEMLVTDYIFLTVEDSAIERTGNELANHFKEKLEGSLVLHCSGALPLKILNSCKQFGASAAVIHPYQTFYYSSKDLLKGIGWSIRSEDRSEELTELIKSLGGIPHILDDDENLSSLYHCSAVVASNFLNTLLSTAKDIASLSGIPYDKFIPQIVRTTVENNFKNDSNEFPLTGPFARTDLKTIENHLESLKSHPHLLKSYCYFALATIEKLKHEKLANEKVLNEMENLVRKNI